jgi:hypothetical protein
LGELLGVGRGGIPAREEQNVAQNRGVAGFMEHGKPHGVFHELSAFSHKQNDHPGQNCATDMF